MSTVVECCRPLAARSLAEDEAEAAAQLFKALADPVCACEFIPTLGLSQATVSHHLNKLTRVGLLEREQRGKWAYFSLNPEAAGQLSNIVRFQEVLVP